MTTHRFEPTVYYTTMGAHPPALHIRPGDRVETTTVCAAGRDAADRPVTPRGNPMTGPFYVEGATPDDTLVVRLESIVPNRRQGWGRAVLAPNVVDPEFVHNLPLGADGARIMAHWDVDVAAGAATLTEPATTLDSVTLPLEPMLGCFGVAAKEGEAISTATSAEHGGNMDYRGFVSGVTVYFPIFAPGALFFLGDGHARQGDGEMSGTGIEISCDVQFSVELIKGRPIGWPRGENESHIFTVGNARPLDQATQHATTEMVRWLTTDYGMDLVTANVLMSQTVEYDLGNMFDPAYTMVCKMAKHWLPAGR